MKFEYRDFDVSKIEVPSKDEVVRNFVSLVDKFDHFANKLDGGYKGNSLGDNYFSILLDLSSQIDELYCSKSIIIPNDLYRDICKKVSDISDRHDIEKVEQLEEHVEALIKMGGTDPDAKAPPRRRWGDDDDSKSQ